MDNGSFEEACVYIWNESVDIKRKVDFEDQPWGEARR